VAMTSSDTHAKTLRIGIQMTVNHLFVTLRGLVQNKFSKVKETLDWVRHHLPTNQLKQMFNRVNQVEQAVENNQPFMYTEDQLMARLKFFIGICFNDRILRNLRKIKGSFDDFRRKQNQIPKAEFFFELTDYKRILLKVRSNYSKFIEIYQNFSVNIIFYHIYLQMHGLYLVQFVHYL